MPRRSHKLLQTAYVICDYNKVVYAVFKIQILNRNVYYVPDNSIWVDANFLMLILGVELI